MNNDEDNQESKLCQILNDFEKLFAPVIPVWKAASILENLLFQVVTSDSGYNWYPEIDKLIGVTRVGDELHFSRVIPNVEVLKDLANAGALQDERVLRCVVQTMEHYRDNRLFDESIVQCCGLGFIGWCMSTVDKAKAVIEAGGLRVTADAMKQFPFVPRVQRTSCFVLHQLTRLKQDDSWGVTKIYNEGFMDLLLVALRNHPSSKPVLEKSTEVLFELAKQGDYVQREHIMDANGPEALWAIIRAYQNGGHDSRAAFETACKTVSLLG